MSEFTYSLFHQRTAENISAEIARLRDSLLSKKKLFIYPKNLESQS